MEKLNSTSIVLLWELWPTCLHIAVRGVSKDTDQCGSLASALVGKIRNSDPKSRVLEMLTESMKDILFPPEMVFGDRQQYSSL
tara:strand:- start:95 stop:343 length:249 start_codon:yes stop_codon:yes gene_type:complete